MSPPSLLLLVAAAATTIIGGRSEQDVVRCLPLPALHGQLRCHRPVLGCAHTPTTTTIAIAIAITTIAISTTTTIATAIAPANTASIVAAGSTGGRSGGSEVL